MIVGIPAVWFLDQPQLQVLGAIALAAGVLCLAIGLWRFLAIKAVITESDPLDRS
jgi:hypothetical protein